MRPTVRGLEDVLRSRCAPARGEMVPLSALVKIEPSFGPERAMRYNGYLAADVNGGPAPGFSVGPGPGGYRAIAAETLPQGITFEWTELTYQEILAGNSAVLVFPLAICWCSWCWPRSTKASRCPLPSS